MLKSKIEIGIEQSIRKINALENNYQSIIANYSDKLKSPDQKVRAKALATMKALQRERDRHSTLIKRWVARN